MTSVADITAATEEIGAGMTRCEACPCCGGRNLEAVACRNDLHTIEGVSDSMKDSDYHACLDCGLIFARRRQSLESVALFYEWFAYLEKRDYAVYPPSKTYLEAKSQAASSHIGFLADNGMLSPGMTIAHVRCDAGSLLAQIRDQFPDCNLYGFDYFDSNIRYAHDQRLDDVYRLNPAHLNLADGTAFDLIICNHIFTHAFDPIADLQLLYEALKPSGVLYVYGEIDHFLRFQPKGPYYQWVALNNFHKQLFSPESLEVFMNKGGFSIEAMHHRKFYMQLIARRNSAAANLHQDSPVALAAQAAAPVMVKNFQRWATARDSRFLGLIKTTSKLKNALREVF